MTTNNSNPDRFSVQAILQGFIDAFDVNKGFIKTYRLLATTPGESIRKYLKEDRTLLTKPIRLVLVSTAIVAFLMFQIMPEKSFVGGFEAGYNGQVDEAAKSEMPEAELKKIDEGKMKFEEFLMDTFSNYYNVMMLLFLPFISLFTFLFYKKCGYNFAEHFIFNTYVLSFQNLLYLLTMPILYFSFVTGSALQVIIAFGYFFYACQRFFDMKFWPSFGRSSMAILLAYILYMIAMMIIMTVVAVVFIKG